MALTWYVDAVGGAATNSGSSPGAAKVTGTGAATTAAVAVVDLSVDAPDLSGVVVGDTIRLNGRVDGIDSTDLFEITNVNDGADTVTVTPTPSTTTSGVTWSIGGAFTLLARAGRVALAGDTVYAKASATYTETITAPNIHYGSATAPIIWEGYSTTPGDNGRVTIDGENLRTTAMLNAGAPGYITVRNFRATRHTNMGWRVSTASYNIFENCESDNNAAEGWEADEKNTFIGCYAHDNTNSGFTANAHSAFLGCVSANNGIHGFAALDSSCILGCVAIGNPGYGIHVDQGAGGHASVVGCTVDGTGKVTDVGIRITGTVIAVTCANNIVYDCGIGIGASASRGERHTTRNNLLFNNTSNYSNWSTQSGEVLTDPMFVNEVTGDYTPNTGSPAISAGYDTQDSAWLPTTGGPVHIGAAAPVPGGGGGGGVSESGWGWGI